MRCLEILRNKSVAARCRVAESASFADLYLTWCAGPAAGRGNGAKGFAPRPMMRAVQKLLESYLRRLKLDPNVIIHSFRVTALTTARERASDIIDLQNLPGHADPRTTLTYIRNRHLLSNSPAYVLQY